MELVDVLDGFTSFIETYYKKQAQRLPTKDNTSLIINFKDLLEYNYELAEYLLAQPEEAFASAQSAITVFTPSADKKFKFRVRNLPQESKITIRNIRTLLENKLILIEGQIKQTSDVVPQVTDSRYECPACGNILTVLQTTKVIKHPTRCGCGRKGGFRLLEHHKIDTQRLIVQENSEDVGEDAQSKSIPVFCREDLVDEKISKKLVPGNKVAVTGILRAIPLEHKRGQSTTFQLSIEANWVETLHQQYDEIEISAEDEKEIKSLAADPEIYEKLIKSMCPSIYGHERIKEGLLLQLFGGVRKVKSDGTVIRGDLHDLLIGDPGSGKSVLLQFISKVAPKARFTAGKSASGAGLTASVVKDEFLGGYALQAGTIALAHKGMCIIDELDKISREHTDSLHEAMEQQTISISKASIQAVLKSEASVLAAANPKAGRFDPYTPIVKQIELSPTLINRFDLIFQLKDIPNKELDRKIASHILNVNQNLNQVHQEIETSMLRKYIASAKRVKPRMSDEAIKLLLDYYTSLRNYDESEKLKTIPLSARQLESLVRLSEASARTRLSEEVTAQDATRAIDLLNYCLSQIGIDRSSGKVDIDIITTGVSSSFRGRVLQLRTILLSFGTVEEFIPLQDIISAAQKQGISEIDCTELLDYLHKQNEIIFPRAGMIKVMS